MNYRIMWPTGEDASEITPEQKFCIINMANHAGLSDVTIYPEQSRNAVMMCVWGMWFGVERNGSVLPDGYYDSNGEPWYKF